MEILETQVIEFLTEKLGRAPTSAEIENGLLAPWTLASVGRTLNSAQSTLSIDPGQDIQGAVDKLVLNGGGILYLNPGIYTQNSNILLPSGIVVAGLLRDDTIIDFNGGPYSIRSVGENAYTTGTISINVGETTVTGSGTAWNEDMVGQTIWLGINYYTIVSVASATSLDIDVPLYGENQVDSVYAIATPIQSLKITDITIQNSSTHGIYVAYSVGGYLFNNFNVYSCGGSGVRSEWNSYPNIGLASFDSNAIGVDFYYTNGYAVEGSLCSNSTSGDGLKLDNSGSATIFNCEMSGNAGHGISATNTREVSISSLSLLENGGAGLFYDQNVQQCQIGQANIESNGTYGVDVSDSTCENNIILGNVFADNASGAVNDSGTGTLIRSNIGVSDN